MIWGLVTFLTMVLLFGPANACANNANSTVESIAVTIAAAEGAEQPPERIAKRMSASVNTVGEHVMIGKKVSDITSGKNSYEKLIGEVFDRILVGYTIEQVVITPGAVTNVQVLVRPWGEVIREVSVDMDFGAVSPEIAGLIKKDIGSLEEKISSVLLGLPIDAVDWAGGVSKTMIRDIFAEHLPEFRCGFEVIPGRQTVIKLSLIPTGKSIQDIQFSLRSHTIPNVLLLPVRSSLNDKIRVILAGLPVSFVERHQDYFAAKINSVIAAQPVVRRYDLSIVADINPGSVCDVTVRVDTESYKVYLEGYLDIGRTKDSTSGRLHVGKMISPKDEVFVDTDFIPSTVDWKFSPGWSHSIGGATAIGIKYELIGKQSVLWMRQQLGRNWSLRIDRMPGAGNAEVGLRYRFNEFISAEYVHADNDKYLRMVGNL